MIKTFNNDQRNLKISEHFAVEDFWACEKHTQIKLDTDLAEFWEKLYAHFGVRPRLRNAYGPDAPDYAPHSTSCYRNHQNWTGDKKNPHCQGRATDVYIPGVAAYRLAQFAETLQQVGGIGLYLHQCGELEKVDRIHIDIGSRRRHWGWNHQTRGYFTPGFGGVPCNFKYGSRSAAVEELQRRLNSLGYSCGEPDGVYGRKTQNAVAAFQADNGIAIDGIYGIKTNEKLGLFRW
ncbi:MAG: peptidoglycan-binding protein [Christensenellales bacterium]